MKRAFCIALLTLTACTHKPVVERPVAVNIPVRVDCVDGWPVKPPPLPDKSHWTSYDVRQKAATIGAHAIRLKDYSQQIEAATSGCL